MRDFLTILLVCLLFAGNVRAESFLTAQSFPKTFEDVSYNEKIEFKANDYDLYRPVYDEKTGLCIKNCAYYGINITQELEKSERDTLAALAKSMQYEQVYQALPVDTQNILSSFSVKSGLCRNRISDIPVGQKVPWGEPLKDLPRISSAYGPRTLEGTQSFHDGIDYSVSTGTPVYTVADGYVVRVINDETCGLGVRIQHASDIDTIYCHLSKVLVSKGDFVGAGCQIAESGDTGHVTGAHLHYGMRDSSRNKIDPSKYTKRKK